MFFIIDLLGKISPKVIPTISFHCAVFVIGVVWTLLLFYFKNNSFNLIVLCGRVFKCALYGKTFVAKKVVIS